jgi:hypothetical protein
MFQTENGLVELQVVERKALRSKQKSSLTMKWNVSSVLDPKFQANKKQP